MKSTDYGYSPALIEVRRQLQQAWMPIADFDMGETDQHPSIEAYRRYEDLARAGVVGILAETPAEVAVSLEMTTSRDLMSLLDLLRAPRPDPPDLLLKAEPTPTGDPVLVRAETGLLHCAR